MKKYYLFLTLVSLLALTVMSRAQTRPRRVGDEGRSQSPESTRNSPPVLGGATYPRQPTPLPTAQPNAEPEEVDAGDIIRVNTNLVTIPVSVMDRDGRYIPNLQKEDFRLWEEGVEQQVAFFSSVDKPFSVVLMLDTSPSTQFRLEDIQDAAVSFVNQLRSDDKVVVVSFNNEVHVLSDLTTDRNKLERSIRRARTGDGTSLYDAVDVVINRLLSRIPGRKAIVLFTDGVDTTSRRASYRSTVQDSQELDALIYPVQYDTSTDVISQGPFPNTPSDVIGQILGGILGGGRRGSRRGGGYPPSGRGRIRGDYETADRYLQDLSNSTGGRQYHAETLQNMAAAFANVAEELRRQYSIGYYPSNPGQPGQRRQITVRATQPNLAVRARDSYIINPSGSPIANDKAESPPVLKRLAAGRGPTQF